MIITTITKIYFVYYKIWPTLENSKKNNKYPSSSDASKLIMRPINLSKVLFSFN